MTLFRLKLKSSNVKPANVSRAPRSVKLPKALEVMVYDPDPGGVFSGS